MGVRSRITQDNPGVLIDTCHFNFLQYELIQFDGIWLTHAEQYRWLQVDYQIGVFISRSSVNLVTINKIWIMAVLQVSIKRLFKATLSILDGNLLTWKILLHLSLSLQQS